MTKQVALAQATYDRLRRSRRPGESFSTAIERLLDHQEKDPMAFVERVPKSKVSAERRLVAIEGDREASWEDA